MIDTRTARLSVVILLLTSVALTEERLMPEVLPPVPVWKDNKLTPEQPFPARVKAISGSWVDYTLLLEEISADKPARICLATIGFQQITYREVPPAEAMRIMRHPHFHSKFFDAPVEVNHFRWDNGLYKLGHVLGKEDSLRKWYIELNKAESDAP